MLTNGYLANVLQLIKTSQRDFRFQRVSSCPLMIFNFSCVSSMRRLMNFIPRSHEFRDSRACLEAVLHVLNETLEIVPAHHSVSAFGLSEGVTV